MFLHFCYLSLLLFVLQPIFIQAQTLPTNRSVDWTLAGLRPDTIAGLAVVDMQILGVVGDGLTPNDGIIDNFIATFLGVGAIFEFPSGQFLFNNTITLPSNFIIKGQGADSTIFLMDLGGSGDAISIQGSSSNDSSALILSVSKDSVHIKIWNSNAFAAGDWVQIKQYDSDWVTSSWAQGSVGQIVQIDSIAGNDIWFKSPLRMDYDTARSPFIQKINPKRNVGIECLKIKRIDDTAPQQTCNIDFTYAINCWVKGIESENCNFAHLKGENASNLYIANSYFHHGFTYDGGGRAYGVVFQFTTGECLAENNIFEHLRHSMLLQAGANGNVFAYNYSLDPFWTTTPNNSAGDMVLHGNYVYANLFEQNICKNIVIDDSHGPNGAYNTFFRNRAESYGIFFSASNSPNQNFIGNDITNTSFPYSLVNYSIQGIGHFLHGNNDKGTIKPAGTQTLPDLSYAYTYQPSFVPTNQWAKIGTPNTPNSASIPAKDRRTNNAIFDNVCQDVLTSVLESELKKIKIFPNPVHQVLNIESDKKIANIQIYNDLGQLVLEKSGENNFVVTIALRDLQSGIYFVKVKDSDNNIVIEKIIKK